MSCTSPLKGFPIGLTDNQKTKYKITNYLVDYIIENKNHSYSCLQFRDGETAESVSALYKNCGRIVTDWIEIPCGKCNSCRLKYSRQWADRCMLELQNHSESCFVTLTYDDLHLKFNSYLDEETGECGDCATLDKRDFQLFMKRLRKYIASNVDDRHIKYFCAGEYGEKSHRPHYHVIIFGWRPDDLELYKENFRGDRLFTSETLNKVWSDSYGNKIGHVVVGDVTWDSCAYTARYILKKQNGPDSDSEKYNFQKEFTLMSLKPSIGREYFDLHKDEMFQFTHFSISTPDGGRQIRPPKYYERLFELESPEDFKVYKELKLIGIEASQKAKEMLTSESYLDFLETQDEIVQSKIDKKLLRRFI